MSQKPPITVTGIREAVEGRNAEDLKAFYAANAVLTIVDKENPPSKPRMMKGAEEIDAYLDDVCGRDMKHKIDSAVLDGEHIAFVESCHYPDGTNVVASAMAELSKNRIVKQTIVQAWDN